MTPCDQKKPDAQPAELAPPPREGLIAGTYRMVDPSRMGLVDRPRLPTRWSARHAGMRLIEAYRIIARMPLGKLWPGGYGSVWPEMSQQKVALVDQGSGSAFAQSRNRVLIGAGADEIARCNDAIAWPMQFLSNRPALARDVNLWASQMTEEEFEKIDDGDASVPWEGLQTIANALNAAHEVVR